jgi:hypothetical protein
MTVGVLNGATPFLILNIRNGKSQPKQRLGPALRFKRKVVELEASLSLSQVLGNSISQIVSWEILNV